MGTKSTSAGVAPIDTGECAVGDGVWARVCGKACEADEADEAGEAGDAGEAGKAGAAVGSSVAMAQAAARDVTSKGSAACWVSRHRARQGLAGRGCLYLGCSEKVQYDTSRRPSTGGRSLLLYGFGDAA